MPSRKKRIPLHAAINLRRRIAWAEGFISTTGRLARACSQAIANSRHTRTNLALSLTARLPLCPGLHGASTKPGGDVAGNVPLSTQATRAPRVPPMLRQSGEWKGGPAEAGPCPRLVSSGNFFFLLRRKG
jgi:hypothetical protein